MTPNAIRHYEAARRAYQRSQTDVMIRQLIGLFQELTRRDDDSGSSDGADVVEREQQ